MASSWNRFVAERLPALRSRDFTIFWIAQIISVVGSQMQFAAINWQIYEKTGNAAALGAVGLVRVVPILFFSFLGGAAADTVDRRRLLLWTQTILSAAAALLGFLSAENLAGVAAIYILTSIGAAATAFDNPARQALVPSLVPEEDVPNAAALSSTGFNVATIAGPVLAGLTLSALGAAYAYYLNALSFVAVIIAVMVVRPVRQEALARSGEVTAKPRLNRELFAEVYRFVVATPILWSIMLLDFFATLFSSASALLPIYAKDILHVGAKGFGILSAFPAVGSLLTGVLLSLLPQPKNTGRMIFYAVLVYGLSTIGFGFSKTFFVAALCLAGTGAADTVSTVLRSTIRNLVTPDRMRGRVIAASMIFFMGGPQLGELEAGVVARYLGAPFSVVSGGVACIISAFAIVASAPILLRFRLKDYLAGKAEEQRPGESSASVSAKDDAGTPGPVAPTP